MGAKVTMERGESSFGKVTDIVLSEGGCVEYLIISYEDELVPVPWGVVKYDVGERTVAITTSVTKEKLRDVRFRSGSWPNFHEDRWMRNMKTVWGDRAFRNERGDSTGTGGDRRDIRDERRDRRDDRRDIRDERRDRRDDRRDDRSTTPDRKPDRPRDDRNTDRPRDDRTPPPRPDRPSTPRTPPPARPDRS